jgi:serine/threonine-protein kinase HipA
MVSTAYIHIWGKTAGAIAWDSSTGLGSFEFDPAFIRNGWDIAPIKMPLAQGKQIFSFAETKNSSTFKGLPGLLADVLPDKYGNAIINAWLAGQGRPSDSLNPVELLCFIGKRGMGAMEFEPVEPKSTDKATNIEIGSLVQAAENILSGRQGFESNMTSGEEKALFDILKIGTSAGGARAKALIAYNAETGEARSGQAAAPKGFSHWLIKFDGVKDSQFGGSSGYGRVEMAYHLMAKDCGIEMTECRLLEENGRAHFMTRRFDRPNEKDKLHVQTFCALQHYDFNNTGYYSYEQLFETMRMLGLPFPQAEQMFRRMVFNVMARNCDDHTKNFAFIMDKENGWKISPAYDVCHAYRPGSTWVSMQSLSVNGKRDRITESDMLAVAKQISLKKGKEIISQIKETLLRWKEYAAMVQTEAALAEAIGKTIEDGLKH